MFFVDTSPTDIVHSIPCVVINYPGLCFHNILSVPQASPTLLDIDGFQELSTVCLVLITWVAHEINKRHQQS